MSDYINNGIEKQGNAIDILNKWGITRERYLDWVSSTKLKLIFEKHFRWNRISIWWSVLPVEKEIYSHDMWYGELHKLLNGDKSNPLILKQKPRFFGFIKDILFLYLTRKNFTSRKRSIKSTVTFLSQFYNLSVTKGVACDRLYSHCPLESPNDIDSSYLIYISPVAEDFSLRKNLFNDRVELLSLLSKKYFVANEFLKYSDIFYVHFGMLWLWIKLALFSSLSKNKFKKYFEVNSIDASDILIPLLFQSFYGHLQSVLLEAKAIERFFRRLDGGNALITYAEFLASSRPIYFFVKSVKPELNIVSVQHALATKNKLYYSHRRSDFEGCNEVEVPRSSRPDFYLVHGLQYKNILAEYFPISKIRIVGSLKYDNLSFINHAFSVKKQVNEKVTILVAPSIGDEHMLIELLRGLSGNQLASYKIIISPHPIIKDVIVDCLNQLTECLDIELLENFTTSEFIRQSDLVIGSISAILVESFILGIPTACAVSAEFPPAFDGDFEFHYISNSKELFQLMEEVRKGIVHKVKNDALREAESYLMGNMDGLTYQRFWKEVREITSA